MQEVVEREGDRVRLASAPRAGDNVRRRGEDLEAGALALRRGTRLSPYDLGLLASLDRVKGAKRRENLESYADQARLSRRLVTLERNVPIDLSPEELAMKP